MKIHAVLNTLLTANIRARRRRLKGSFSSPSRSLLTVIVLLLIFMWTGQTVAAMFFRNPWPPEQFRFWSAISVAMWASWHLVRVAWKRPDAPIEWSESEQQQIVARPFSAVERFVYRCGTILTATLPKVVLTTCVLWPDLSWFSPVGLVLILVGLELFRMLTDAATCCLSKRSYLSYRIIMIATVCGFAVYLQSEISDVIYASTNAALVSESALSLPASLIQWAATNSVSQILLAPFLVASSLISGHGSAITILYHGLLLCSVLIVIAVATFRLERLWHRQKLLAERRLWATDVTAASVSEATDQRRFLMPSFVGSPLMWRQWKRAVQFASSLAVSMVIPAILLAPAAVSMPNSNSAFIAVVCGAFFYTFILLPEAIKFDFRLDSEYLVMLKALPMTPVQIVRGQLAVPVLLASAFQWVLFFAVGWYRGVAIDLVLVAVLLSIPVTVLFVAIDNLIFLQFPHRPTQEGFEAFFRTILKFTGKSALLALFAAALLLWAPLCHGLTVLFALESTRTPFLVGVLIGASLLAMISFYGVVSTFRRFDVSAHAV
ncbi:MAG: hypothetical protein ABJZ55_09880 [Fuerstiella sp.]